MKYYLMYWDVFTKTPRWARSGYFAAGVTDINKAYDYIATLPDHYIVVEETDRRYVKAMNTT